MNRRISLRIASLFSVALILAFTGFTASAQTDEPVQFEIPPQPLSDALILFGDQSGRGVMADSVATETLDSPGFSGKAMPEVALKQLLEGTGLTYRQDGDVFVIVLPGTTSAAGTNVGQRRPGIEEIIVTGQKREERIQDVPIAISAFSQKDLEAQKLEGGFDLVKAIPNVSFTKTNFTSYNFQIRGVGTQSISATSDPGVAVSLNNTAIIQNRLFEQEYLDVERVEVLRGPQGTLYGRNATAGVINVITNKPELGVWDGSIKLETGNYSAKRLRGMFNMPVGDTIAIRGAYAGTDRDGYTYNSGTGNRVDGRDLWTGRLSVAWQPTDRFRADVLWEHFKEDDDRLRTGKQLCHRDDGPAKIGDTVIADLNDSLETGPLLRRAVFSQGCKGGDLYSDSAFGTPNGLSYNFVLGLLNLRNLPLPFVSTGIGYNPDGDDFNALETIIQPRDPYGGKVQSRDLREIESIRDPNYRAESDIFELNLDFDLTQELVLSSQTAYVHDQTFSFQDFNRFNSQPIFTDTTTLVRGTSGENATLPSFFANMAPGGVFCDPQIGCSDTIAGFDIAQADARQFSQELRLQSSFSGPLNFSVGANYTKFETLVDYYVMFNLVTAMAGMAPFSAPVGTPYDHGFFNYPENPDAVWDPTICPWSGLFRDIPNVRDEGPVPVGDPRSACPYIDPNAVNPEENFEGDGHNYFRSKNPYELESWAGFGEVYWNIRDDLKLTVGLRYTDDQKTFVNVPSQLLMAPTYVAGGYASRGYPTDGQIEQQWGEWTGRLVLDWQPVLDFTDETLIYGSFSRGYKGGGANPPTPGFATTEQLREIAVSQGEDAENFFNVSEAGGLYPILQLNSKEYDQEFEPEFVNAYEVGTKNTLFGGAVMLNATAFYYDYTDYQVSQIRDRTAVNENFDASMWGLELESVFVPSPNWQFLANIGYLKTEIARGETSIDIMDRIQSNPDYMVVKPWAQLPSNCVVPTVVAESYLHTGLYNYIQLCGLSGGLLGLLSSAPPDPNFGGDPYDPNNYPELNGGAGLLADLGGNELPNAPHLTVTLGGQHSFDLTPNWRGTVRLDYYWQDDSYHRVYNDEPYDHLRSWSNTNLSFWVESEKHGIKVEGYVKNLFDNTPITGAFLNSDDTGLTTNVFMFDPRLIGLSVRKDF